METKNKSRSNGSQFAWIGFALGIACMAALFVYGLIAGIQPLLVMSSSTAALLGAVWASTVASAKKRANS